MNIAGGGCKPRPADGFILIKNNFDTRPYIILSGSISDLLIMGDNR